MLIIIATNCYVFTLAKRIKRSIWTSISFVLAVHNRYIYIYIYT